VTQTAQEIETGIVTATETESSTRKRRLGRHDTHDMCVNTKSNTGSVVGWAVEFQPVLLGMRAKLNLCLTAN
jgi:hypothetical protein